MAGNGAAPGQTLAATVRRHDADRYIATLYAPEHLRPPLWAVYAAAAELAQIRTLVSESALGEIRLEWWRLALDGRAGGHPVADALGPVIENRPQIANWLRTMIDGHSADLYADPIADMTELEARFGATVSLPVRMAISLLAPDADEATAADAAGHGGVALGLVRLLSHFADAVGRRPELIPREILKAHGVTIAGLAAQPHGPVAQGVTADLAAAARSHLDRAVKATGNLPLAALPALLPLAPLRGDLRLIAGGNAGMAGPLRRGPVYRQWSMWRAARRGTIL